MGVAAFHTDASGSTVSGKSSFTYLLRIMPGPSAVSGSAPRSSRNNFIILYYTVHHEDTEIRPRGCIGNRGLGASADRPQVNRSSGYSGFGLARSEHSL